MLVARPSDVKSKAKYSNRAIEFHSKLHRAGESENGRVKCDLMAYEENFATEDGVSKEIPIRS